MEIFFLRHGDAEEKKEGAEDKERPLNSKGAATISKVAKSLKRIAGDFDLILSSPLLRARQTADIIRSALGIKDKIVESENLIVGTTPGELLKEIGNYKDLKRLLIVGHQPHLGICVSYITGLNEEKTSIKKGGIALVNIKEFKKDQGELVWIKDPGL